jgi:hypothetical protein
MHPTDPCHNLWGLGCLGLVDAASGRVGRSDLVIHVHELVM